MNLIWSRKEYEDKRVNRYILFGDSLSRRTYVCYVIIYDTMLISRRSSSHMGERGSVVG
jgi:hypothetical protein